MQSFTTHINEDKKRFIRKNKNMNNFEKIEIIKFFQKNRQAESKVNWNKSKDMTYDDFLDIMMQSKLGRKTNLKCNKIKVKSAVEGEDYVHIIMKTKEYCAYIPLNYETAKKFNTRELGVCGGPWCIGHSDTPFHWNSEIIEYKQIPIYIVNKNSKWIVMIKDNNRNYDIWSVENKPNKTHEGIPNFSVRKELLNSNQKNMYDEIRDEYYNEDEIEEIDIDDAINDYESLVEDIETARNDFSEAYDEFNNEAYQIISDTKIWYLASIEEKEDEKKEDEEELEHYNNDINNDDLNQDEKELIINSIEQLEEDIESLNYEIEELQSDYDTLEDIAVYEMNDYDIKWTEDPPYEDDILNNLHYPSVYDFDYSDYLELAENYMDFWSGSDKGTVDSEINLYIQYEYGSTSFESAIELLSDYGLYHPEIVNN